MTGGNDKRKQPWGKMAKWGGLYLLGMMTLAVIAFALGLVTDAQSDLIGKGIGAGLVAVAAAAAATGTKV